MKRATLINIIKNPTDGEIIINAIQEYCIEKGKSESETMLFIDIITKLHRVGMPYLANCRDYIIDVCGREQGIAYLYDQNHELIDVY